VRGELLGGFFSLLGYSTSLLFGFETIVTGVFFWVMCGWMIGLLEGEKNSLRRIPIIILTLATLASTIVSFRWMEARFMMAEARRAFAAGNIAESLQDFGEALGTFPFDRELTIEAVEVALRGFERAQDVPTERTLRSFLTQKLRILEQITGGHDGFVPLFRAWLAAVDGDVTLVEQELSRAFDMQPSSVSTYRIAAHCYELLGDEQKVLRMQQRLIELLPPAWRDPQSERGRILRKENSWLLEKPFSTGTPHRSDRR
jgi:tetratricopeptide (TPR) repeat protein